MAIITLQPLPAVGSANTASSKSLASTPSIVIKGIAVKSSLWANEIGFVLHAYFKASSENFSTRLNSSMVIARIDFGFSILP